jgi:uncharacterized membrane protein YfcA
VAAGLSLLAVLLASYIKGVIGFGFPTVSTPIVALFLEPRAAIAILILPNLVMDGIQMIRKPGLLDTLRRHAILLLFGIGGTFRNPVSSGSLAETPADPGRLRAGLRGREPWPALVPRVAAP